MTSVTVARDCHHAKRRLVRPPSEPALKDSLCVDVCPTDCIHPKLDEPAFEASTQVYVDPEGVLTAAPAFRPRGSDSIHALEDVPEEKKELIETNAAFYQY